MKKRKKYKFGNNCDKEVVFEWLEVMAQTNIKSRYKDTSNSARNVSKIKNNFSFKIVA